MLLDSFYKEVVPWAAKCLVAVASTYSNHGLHLLSLLLPLQTSVISSRSLCCLPISSLPLQAPAIFLRLPPRPANTAQSPPTIASPTIAPLMIDLPSISPLMIAQPTIDSQSIAPLIILSSSRRQWLPPSQRQLPSSRRRLPSS